MSGVEVIQSLSRSNNDIRISEFGCVLLEVRTPSMSHQWHGTLEGNN